MSDDAGLHPAGGQGEPPSRADLELHRQALRNDWPIPPAVKRRVLQGLVDLADPEADGVSKRTRLAAARILAQYANLQAKQAMIDIARERWEHEKAEATGGSGMAEVHERMAAYVDPDEPDGRPGPDAGVVQAPDQPV